jgi:hypothetical protein
VDALDAEGAFFHDAAAAYRDIRVELVMERENQFPVHLIGMEWLDGVIAPVELTHLIRTVVGTVARPDTAIVDLEIQVMRLAVDRSKYRADRLTGSAATLLA